MSLVVVGSMAFDAIETPFGKSDRIIGGAGTYIAWCASNFTPVKQISVVGGDFPDSELAALTARGVDLEGVQIKKDEKTFFWSGRYHMDMNSRDTLETQLNVLENFVPVVPDSFQDCEFLMLGNLVPSVRQMSKEHSLVKAAQKILKMGPKYLIIKKGEHGALLFHENQVFFAPALPLEEVVDPTGAGDTFAGGFAGYLAKTQNFSFENMKRAIIVGSAMASYTCEKFGPERLLEINQDDINKRVAEFVSLVNFDIELV